MFSMVHSGRADVNKSMIDSVLSELVSRREPFADAREVFRSAPKLTAMWLRTPADLRDSASCGNSCYLFRVASGG
jgi:hypothetical protein